MEIEKKLEEMGLKLPKPPMPGGSYIPVQIAGNLAFTAGQIASIDGERRYLGKVGDGVSLTEGVLSARDSCLNCLASLKQELGSLERVKKIVKVLGFVNSAPGFLEQPAVINGASDLLTALWGDIGKHARSAVGVAELPFGASVEIEMIVEI